jgi:UDP-N-acetylglucosamine acyltransferase
MISPLASVHPKAKIANNVSIEPFSTISANVEIGEGTWIGPNVTIMDGARIGKNCKIFPGAVISAIPQDLKFKGEDTLAEIGDGTVIRECVTINRGTVDKNTTKIGNNCLIMAYAHVAHDCILGNNIILANNVNLAGHVTIEDYAILEGMAAVGQFLRIGAHTFIAGGTLVRKNVPPYTKAAREPISYVGINSVGLRRRGFSDDEIRTIEDIYRILYVKGYSISNAIPMIESEIPEGPIKAGILEFINSSTNGIMKGYSRD